MNKREKHSNEMTVRLCEWIIAHNSKRFALKAVLDRYDIDHTDEMLDIIGEGYDCSSEDMAAALVDAYTTEEGTKSNIETVVALAFDRIAKK